jgi:hypothetical protein
MNQPSSNHRATVEQPSSNLHATLEQRSRVQVAGNFPGIDTGKKGAIVKLATIDIPVCR